MVKQSGNRAIGHARLPGWRLPDTAAPQHFNQATKLGDPKLRLGDPKPRLGDPKPRLGHGCPVGNHNRAPRLNASKESPVRGSPVGALLLSNQATMQPGMPGCPVGGSDK